MYLGGFMILVVDFGGQFNQLVARRIRDLGVYSYVCSYKNVIDSISLYNPKGIIFTGGPNSVNDIDSPSIDEEVFNKGIPILGICYGAQLIAKHYGGKIVKGDVGEYGKHEIKLLDSKLYKGIESNNFALMSHFDKISILPDGFINTSKTINTPNASFEDEKRNIFAIQYHAEVDQTPFGNKLFSNFVFDVCKEDKKWNMSSYKDEAIKKIKDTVGDKKVIMALSGGVDSSVTAMLLHKAIGDNFTCVFVDHGLLRKNEAEEVVKVFKDFFGLNLIKVDAKELFLNDLKGVTDPEKKRKMIGSLFIDVFKKEALSLKDIEFLAQGTIYADVIESGTDTSDVIKSHHNVGGLPKDMPFKLIEPLRMLFKDEVRALGLELGLSEEIVFRQPFPGPGLAIRIIGNITEEALYKVRESDAILREEIKNANLDRKIWQYFTVLPNVKSVGVMGDERTYFDAIGIRAVLSKDGMTSDFAKIPYDVLEKISKRIVNEVKGVNRVLYDITPKPPSTIEWE